MKIYCITWKDERWSADKKTLQQINGMINKEKKSPNLIESIVCNIFYTIGWVFFNIYSLLGWIQSKIKNKK